MEQPILYMIIPCYNEQDVLPETAKQLGACYTDLIRRSRISPASRIVFVNDGSKDKTWEIICMLHRQDPALFSGISLAHNAGHQNALLAGLMTVKERCDITISMDADLQDDVNAIEKMVLEYQKGNEIVYGVRSERKKDSFFKKATAEGFYKLMQNMGTEVVYNHADFRLMSQRALRELAEFREVNLFLRGLVPLLGFQTSCVYYERQERFAGTSKYPLGKMLSFAMEGITSFSVKPLKIIIILGFLMVAVSIAMLIWAIVSKLFSTTVPGWSSTVCSIWLIGGMQLLCLGVIGEYVGKIYAEVKQRPRYIIAEFLDQSEGSAS